MSWDCRRICCPFDNGEECLHDGTCALVLGKKFDYPYIKSAFEKCRADAIDEFVKRIEEHQQQNWIENLEYGITYADIEAVANEMKEQKDANNSSTH